MFTIEQLVPQDHLIRTHESAVLIHVFIDSTHVKAGANKRKFEKEIVRKETRAYEAKLQEEFKGNMESTTDPESGYYVKDERGKQFACSFHAAVDRYGFTLGSIVTPGNVHDSYMLQPLVEKTMEKSKSEEFFRLKSDYKNPKKSLNTKGLQNVTILKAFCRQYGNCP